MSCLLILKWDTGFNVNDIKWTLFCRHFFFSFCCCFTVCWWIWCHSLLRATSLKCEYGCGGDKPTKSQALMCFCFSFKSLLELTFKASITNCFPFWMFVSFWMFCWKINKMTSIFNFTGNTMHLTNPHLITSINENKRTWT